MDASSDVVPPITEPAPDSLHRSVSQQSAASSRSHRSAVRSSRHRKPLSQPSSSTSSIVAGEKSLISFPSFSPEPPRPRRPGVADYWEEEQLKTATKHSEDGTSSQPGTRAFSIVDSLTNRGTAPNALFEELSLKPSVPGALHHADDDHIQRLVARDGAVNLVRQIAEDLAQRNSQIALIRRRADERERALRRLIRECGLSNLELETRLRSIETELRAVNDTEKNGSGGVSHLMSDAMQEDLTAYHLDDAGDPDSNIRLASANASRAAAKTKEKATSRGWKEYLWGNGTARKIGRSNSANGEYRKHTAAERSRSSTERRPQLQDDLFKPPEGQGWLPSLRSASHASSTANRTPSERRSSASLASLALRMVVGGSTPSREADDRGRTVSSSAQVTSARPGSAASASRAGPSTHAVSVAGGSKALMALRRSNPTPQAPPSTKPQAQETRGTAAGSAAGGRTESYDPVEMDAIRPPETQPPTLTHIYNNFPSSEFLTDRFGFIYDQRRKKRQREATRMAQDIRDGSRTEMLIDARSRISPDHADDATGSSRMSISSANDQESAHSQEESNAKEAKPKRWQDYLRIATFPTELLSHTPGIGSAALEVLEAADSQREAPDPTDAGSSRSSVIMPISSGLVPQASTTTALDSEALRALESESQTGTLVKEDVEPVKMLLKQLIEVHDALQRDKTVKWNDFLRKVRAERRREGEAAAAAAAAVAEARFEKPAMILPETHQVDGEIIGISGLGNKGKVGRAKWNEFKSLVLGGIPVSFRAKVWSECCGANGLRVPGYYEDLVSQGTDGDDAVAVSQIGMDIHRTLTDNIFFRKGPGVQKLNEVLLAYSRRNREVGYCQGMNLVAANLLLVMPSAEEAFWVLTCIIEKILPHGYYDHSLIASRADQQVLRQYVSTVLPNLSAHLEVLSVELEALTFQWFLSVFTDCLCAEALFRVWDVVLCTNDGSTFLFQVALALLKLNESNLLRCETPAAVYTYINHHMTEHAISIDGLLQASEGLRRVVRRDDVEPRRDKAIKAEQEVLAERDGKA